MNDKVLIRASRQSNLLKAIIDYMEYEKIDYCVEDTNQRPLNNIGKIVYIDDNSNDFDGLVTTKDLSIVVISSKMKVIDCVANINYIITNLVFDETNYSDVQREYLFKKGIYHIFISKFSELLENANGYNGMIYDLTELKPIPNNWIFSFDSINDTYSWLLKKNKMLPNNYIRKVINFYDDKVYDDSLREINYLTAKLMEIKEGKNVIDIFICSRDELRLFEKNYFFKLLIKNISLTYRLFLIDKEKLIENDSNLLDKLRDGIAIYNDCVYRDTYDDEISLGYVDCNLETINEYNNYFDYILNKYGKEINSESDLDEF